MVPAYRDVVGDQRREGGDSSQETRNPDRRLRTRAPFEDARRGASHNQIADERSA
jgi:hypothetical protein